EFKGFLSDKELNKEYNECSIVCVPALHEDSFGLSLMEAISIGKPVISTDSIGSPKKEKIKELRVKKGDSEDLSKMLLKTLNNKKFYEQTKKDANKRIELFKKENVMKKYLETYKKLEL
ncbi:MAG: glycosyltransferase, partial [Candidatus Diapherotrites archaeon]|nr:glycosyltransferase [Candidatus Diapherotrites archaeon]